MDHTFYHRYYRLVKRGLASPLAHDCNVEYVLQATEDGDTVLWCIPCNVRVQPGLRDQDKVRSVVEEFFTPGYTFDGRDL